ncbi:hypothetical protein [uncultured Ruegeria sp.]|uniref:hypothetical protein n=1 Tax=uncultured Ruegeria sp. TaxID=259304 RepID=UPI002610B40C|nr:hypothetical protein [uncultured Ruegeria sp.]
MYGYSIAEWELIEGQKQRAEHQAKMVTASAASATAYQEMQRAEQEYAKPYFDYRNDTSFQPNNKDETEHNLGDFVLGIVNLVLIFGGVLLFWL